MEKMINNFFGKKTNIILLVLNLLFIVYYSILSFYSRPHYDDLHFLWLANDMSVGQFVREMFNSVSGRFVGYFNIAIMSKIILFFNDHRFFPILYWIWGASMTWYVAKSIFKNLHPLFLLNISLFFYNLYVLTNIDFAVFNWLCAMDYYLSAPMLLLLIYKVNQKEISLLKVILLILLVLLIGGNQESFTPVALGSLFLNGLCYLKINHFRLSVLFKDSRFLQILIVAILMLMCFVIVYIAPGNYHRMEMSEFVTPTTITGYLSGFAKAIGMFFYQISFYTPYYLILAILFLLFGYGMKQNKLYVEISYKKMVVYSVLLYILYVVFSVFPGVYLWSGFGIQRIYTHLVFTTMLFIGFQTFIFGYYSIKNFNNKILTYAFETGIVVLIAVMCINLYTDTISARTYANSVDERIDCLQQLNKGRIKGVVTVRPLVVPYSVDVKYNLLRILGKKNNPKPVLYYISDTGIAPNEYNHHLKKLYHFKFDIKLPENAIDKIDK